VGNSLVKINYNFGNLDTAVCNLASDVARIGNISALNSSSIAMHFDNDTRSLSADFNGKVSNENGGAGSITGILKAVNGVVAPAIANVDYVTPSAPPNLTGDITSIGYSTSYSQIVPSSKGGAGTVNGILKGNGAGVVTAATPATDYYVPGTNLVCASLSASGTVRATGDIIAFSASDERLKTDIVQLTGCLNKLSEVRGVSYAWNEDVQTIHQGSDVGVIAQEIEKVLPQAVTTRDDGYMAVRYEKLVPLLIESIKELTNRVEQLESSQQNGCVQCKCR
jgi:hypothetical protein